MRLFPKLYSPVLKILLSGLGNIVISCKYDYFAVTGGLGDSSLGGKKYKGKYTTKIMVY